MVSRAKKRWSGRLRTAGALLILLGAVGLGDALVSFGGQGGGAMGAQLGVAEGLVRAALLLAVGGLAFFVGRQWSSNPRT